MNPMRIKNNLISGVTALALFALALPAVGAVTIKVATDGSVSVEEKKVTRKELAAIVADEVKRDKEATVLIIAKADVPIEAVAEVMATCRKAGINRFSIKSDEKQ